jgi:hypothetical protein
MPPDYCASQDAFGQRLRHNITWREDTIAQGGPSLLSVLRRWVIAM